MNVPLRSRWYVLGMLACSLTACGQEAAESYFPLEPGLHWHYRVMRTTMDGLAELRHAVATRPGDGRYSGVRETLAGTRYYYAAGDDGVFRVASASPETPHPRELARPELVLPLPPLVDAQWQGTTTTAVLENTGPPWETLFRIAVPVAMTFHIASANDTVDTPAGRFEGCVKVVGRGRTNTDVGNYIGHTGIEVATTEWYAPGVGLVRLEREERTGAEALNYGRLEMTLANWSRE